MIALRGLHPDVRAWAEWLHGLADYYGVEAVATSGYRSLDDQRQLRDRYERCVASGRFPSPPDCLYPANKPGDSAHNYGLAWDSTVPSQFQGWWDAVRRWAGFEVLENDRIHAQVPSWRRYVS